MDLTTLQTGPGGTLEFLSSLESADFFRPEDLRGVRTLERLDPTFDADFPKGIHPALIHACKENGIERLFEHQSRAVTRILGGSDIVLVSPTATGKTLCFNLPVISKLYQSPQHHALYLYPTKALANDQLLAIKQLTEHLPSKHGVSSWPFDGDTEQDARRALKDSPPNILITNPDSLHYAILAWNEHWLKLLPRLKYLVLDEAHEYRGYFGTNVAYVIRRLLSLCAALGSRPQIILCSATIANPEEHARALTGRRIPEVRSETAGRPKKHLAFLNPSYPDYQYENILLRKLSALTRRCVEERVSNLVFCPTRRFVERLNRVAGQEFAEHGLDATAIAPYKAGYTPEERREIERGLKDGSKLVVFSTNALELGIDMGRLDMVTMVGFPETVMSAWQRAGRAGRSIDKEALVLFLASRNPIDQFYVENIDLFVEKPLDRLAVNLENEELLDPHALCALFELNGDKKLLSQDILGKPLVERAKALEPDMKLLKKVRPQRRVDLRSIFGQTYVIRSGVDKEIGTISGDKLFSEVYIGAIYDHYGRSWRVKSHGAGEVFVEPNDRFHHTRPTRWWTIDVQDYKLGHRWITDELILTVFFGRVEVTDRLVGYKEYDEKTGDVVDEVTYAAVQSKTYRTDSCFFEVEFQDGRPPDQQVIGVHSVEHAVRAIVPLAIPCDPFDVAGLTVKGGLGAPTSYIYDAVRGGIGISRAAFASFPELLDAARRVLSDCSCKAACPRCIQIPRCEHYNENLDRHIGTTLVDDLLPLVQSEGEVLDLATMGWRAP
jgi:DEAD/DEAH box helicase domain-containing protein